MQEIGSIEELGKAVGPPPGKPSALVRLAIADAKMVDRAKYRPVAYTWHASLDNAALPSFIRDEEEGKGERTCFCDAGAILIGALRAPAGVDFNPNMTLLAVVEPGTDPWTEALIALDCIRGGEYMEALKLMSSYSKEFDIGNFDDASVRKGVPIAGNQNFIDWDMFDRHMADMDLVADGFEAIGL